MLNIGDFARFAGVSVRMLHHYDALGLLVPTAVDPHSGYRRYDESLLARAHQLVALKELGFSLEQVGALLDQGIDPAGFRELLRHRRDELAGSIRQDQARLAEVERRLRLMEGDEMSTYEEKPLPGLELTGVTDVVPDLSGIGPRIGPMFEQLVSDVQRGGGHVGHPGYAWYAEEGDGLRIGAGYELSGLAPEGTAVVDLEPVERAVTTVFTGHIADIGEAWQALGQYVAGRGLRFSGPCREVYLATGVTAESPDAWVVELQQPVA